MGSAGGFRALRTPQKSTRIFSGCLYFSLEILDLICYYMIEEIGIFNNYIYALTAAPPRSMRPPALKS